MDRAVTGRVDPNRAAFDYKSPWRGDASATEDPLFDAVIGTRAFARLEHVRFLGGIDYLRVPSPNGRLGSRRYTRRQHSLGVFRLALLYCDVKRIAGAERRMAGLAALLHDIGHAPLSHSLEPLFKAEFGIDHHRATEAIVTGAVPVGREVAALLRTHRVDVDRLVAVMGGREPSLDGFFSGPINFDTIEGILRTQTYEKPAPRVASPETVVIAATRRSGEQDRILVDEFWSYKDIVYRFIINAESGVLADAACQAFMRRNLASFSERDFFTSEDAVFSKMPGLRKLLGSAAFAHEVGDVLDAPLPYAVRRFTVEAEGDFFVRQDALRYRQSRTDAILRPRRAGDDAPGVEPRDMFNDILGD